MRKILLVFIAAILFVLAACSAPNPENEENDNAANLEGNTQEENEQNEEEQQLNEDGEIVTEEEIVDEEESIEPLYRVSENWSLVPIKEGINENVVLLTIDDAPDQYAVEMAKILKELDAGAIFFVNGHFIDQPEEQEKLKQIYDMGFVIGNHTYSHVNLKTIENDPEKTRDEIVKLNEAIEEIIGEKPKFFRAPHGVNTDISKQIVEEEEMVLMNWTYGYDYFQPYMNKDKLVTAMVTGEGPEVDVPYSLLRPGANLLMHDREWTKDALREIVIGLREQGYEILDPHVIETKQ